MHIYVNFDLTNQKLQNWRTKEIVINEKKRKQRTDIIKKEKKNVSQLNSVEGGK